MRILLVFFVCLFGTAAAAESLPLAVPFEFANNQVFLRVAVGKSKPLLFILDSGASGSCIDMATARRLKIKTEGSAQGTGAGHGTVEIRFAHNLTYRLLGASHTAERSYVIDFAGQKTLLGRAVNGILGYDFFAHYVVALDFETRVMTLADPASFDPQGHGEAVAFTLEHHTPHIPVTIKVAGQDAVTKTLLVDAGSGDALDSDVLGAAPGKVEIVGGVGLGQEFRATEARADWIGIGPYKLAAPIGGVEGVPLIGLETLRRFDVVFDYARNRIFFRPNRFLAEPFTMDASGLDLRYTPDLKGFVLHDVAKDSAGEKVGLAPGDVIVAVANQNASAFTIEQMQRMLSKDGGQVTLTVRRGQGRRDVTLDLHSRL